MMKSKKKPRRPESYKARSYRLQANASGLIGAHVQIKETDLHIQADRDVQRRAAELVFECRLQLESHILKYPRFYSSLQPLAKDFTATPFVQQMYDAGRRAGVGPMAAVAGAIAEYVGKKLLAEGVEEIIIENGGDIFICRKNPCRLAIFAGQSPLSGKVGIELSPPMPWGVCTSSASVGHSLSMGEADSVTVIARSTYLADAAATRICNEVRGAPSARESVGDALQVAQGIEGVAGVVIICGEYLGAVGEVKLIKFQ